jgi:hypothetical protein
VVQLSLPPSLVAQRNIGYFWQKTDASNLNLHDKKGDIIKNPAILPIRLSASVNNSTRFPFIEPPEGIPFLAKNQQTGEDKVEMDYVVDGGYYDNYGAITLLDVFRSIHEDQPLIVIQITSDPEISDGLDEYWGDAKGPIDEACLPSEPRPTAFGGDLATLYQAAMAARSWTGLIYAENLRSLAIPAKDPKTGQPNRVQWFHLVMRFIYPPLGWSLSAETRHCNYCQNDVQCRRSADGHLPGYPGPKLRLGK